MTMTKVLSSFVVLTESDALLGSSSPLVTAVFSGASSGSWNLLFSGRMVRGVCWRLSPATEELSNKVQIPGISRTIFRHSCQYTQQSNAGKDCFIVSRFT